MNEREQSLFGSMYHLKEARRHSMEAAKILDKMGTMTATHEQVMSSVAENDDAQELLGKVIQDGFVFRSSIPERCDYIDHDVPEGVGPQCFKEAGHEGPHMHGPDEPPPAA